MQTVQAFAVMAKVNHTMTSTKNVQGPTKEATNFGELLGVMTKETETGVEVGSNENVEVVDPAMVVFLENQRKVDGSKIDAQWLQQVVSNLWSVVMDGSTPTPQVEANESQMNAQMVAEIAPVIAEVLPQVETNNVEVRQDVSHVAEKIGLVKIEQSGSQFIKLVEVNIPQEMKPKEAVVEKNIQTQIVVKPSTSQASVSLIDVYEQMKSAVELPRVESRVEEIAKLYTSSKEVVSPPSKMERVEVDALAMMLMSKEPMVDRQMVSEEMTQVMKQEVVHQVHKGIVGNLSLGKDEFVMKLNPQGLGEITVKMQSDGLGKISLQIFATSSEVKNLLNSEIVMLKEALRPHNAVVQEISTASSFSGLSEQSMFQQQRQQQAMKQDYRYYDAVNRRDDVEEQELSVLMLSKGLINTYV